MGEHMVEKTNKRELILAAAREIFCEKGSHNVTSEEIAKRAGVGKGTIYQYFDSKQEIFTEIHLLYIKEYCQNIAMRVNEADTFAENMHRLIDFHIENVYELSQYGMQIMEEVRLPAINSERRKQLMEAFKQEVKQEQIRVILLAQQRGEIVDVEPELIIYCLLGTFLGITHMMGTTPLQSEQKEKLKEQLLQMTLHGLLVRKDNGEEQKIL